MRTLFIIPLVLMSLVSFPSWGLTYDDLVKREGIYYKKFTDVPFTGEVDEGVSKGSIKNGKMEGYWERYWYNGQLKGKGSTRTVRKKVIGRGTITMGLFGQKTLEHTRTV